MGAGLAVGSVSLAWGGPAEGSSGRRRGPTLAATAVRAGGQVQRYVSRPDLQPAAVVVSTSHPGQSAGLVLTDSHGGPGQQGVMVLDGRGDLVWFNPVSAGPTPARRAMNLRAQTYRGKPVLSWFEGAVVYGHGQGYYRVVDQSYSQVARVEAANGYLGDLHEFYLTPAGTAMFSCYGLAHADLSRLGGGRRAPYFYGVAQEVDVETGKVVFQWRSDEHVALEESYAPLPKGTSTPWDYFHINSISPTADGNLVISARNTWAVYKVDKSTGQVLWRMGGKRSDFSFGPGARYFWQHDVVAQPDGTFTVFDNGAGDYVSEPQSRGLVLRADPSSRHVSLLRQYLHPGKPLLAGALGSVQPLAGGHVFMGWGVEGYFTEFAASGQPLLDAHLAGQGTLSYRAFRSAWSATPKGPPDLAVQPAGPGMTVYASWNGATAVDGWLVLGGSRPTALETLGTAPRLGFETAIRAPHRPAYVAVAALGADGQRLATSKALAT